MQTSIDGFAPPRKPRTLTPRQQAEAARLVIEMICGRITEAQCRAALEAL